MVDDAGRIFGDVLFPCLITERELRDDTYYYSAVEQSIDPATGQYVNAFSPRQFDKDLGPLLVELNNRSVEVPTLAWVRFRTINQGEPLHEFSAGDGAGAMFLVLLTDVGPGIDGGTAWAGIIQREVGGIVGDYKAIGDGGYVMYPSPSWDGATGDPEVGDYVYATPDPIRAGRWLFIPKENKPYECGGCSWLAELSHKSCLLIQQFTGNGRCNCVPATQGHYAFYDADQGGWLDTAMGIVCCGCGGLVFVPPSGDPDDEDFLESAYIKMLDFHVSCAGGSGGGSLFTKKLHWDCCGVDKLGRRYARFYGFGPDPCDGELVGCTNVFWIIATCADCPDTICECSLCGECCTGATPYGWWADVTGFPDNHLNGFWILSHVTGQKCKYEGLCAPSVGGAYSYTLDLELGTDPITGDPAIIATLTITGGGTYQKVNWDCCGDNTMTKVSGDGPDTITLHPIIIDGECPTCDKDWPDSLTLTVLDIELIDGGFGAPVYPLKAGDEVTLTKIPPTPPAQWTPALGWWSGAAGIPYPAPYNADPTYVSTIIYYTCAIASLGCAGFAVSQSTGPPAGTPTGDPPDFETLDCTCTPVYMVGKGKVGCATTTGCYYGAWPFQSTIKWTVQVNQ